MKFTVERKTWWRGKPGASLLRTDGMRCCIGFVCKQAGMTDRELRRMGTVDELIGVEDSSEIPAILREGSSSEAEWIGDAYAVNDNCGISDAAREKQLQELAASAGHELVFVDEFSKEVPA